MNNKIRAIGALCLALIWAALTCFAWFSPADEASLSERRALAQFPETSQEEILSGRFMSKFEDYTTDQFPLRDKFRQLKATFHQYGLFQSDNNDLYISDGYIAKIDYPLNEKEVTAATKKFNAIYNKVLKDSGCNVYLSLIPDKSYYLDSHHLALDHEAMFALVQKEMPYATYIDITKDLELSSYYRTDTHWRQETLVPVAQTLCQAMGMPAPTEEEFTAQKQTQPFYGVYHGQAALPVEPDTMYLMQSETLSDCVTYIHDGKGFKKAPFQSVYDLEKLDGKDPYETYLSGTQSVMLIRNPNAASDRSLVIFRDSFGSSLSPLLVSEYKNVFIFDIREFDSRNVNKFISFNEKQDVLFLYSSLVLNTGSMIK